MIGYGSVGVALETIPLQIWGSVNGASGGWIHLKLIRLKWKVTSE